MDSPVQEDQITRKAASINSAVRCCISVDSLIGRAIVLADHDGGNKVWRDERLMKALGKRFHLTAGREVENMLPSKVLRAVLLGFGESEDAAEHVFGDGSEGQWQDAGLGTWVDQRLKNGKYERKRAARYAAVKGHTLRDKDLFAEKAFKALEKCTFEDLRPAVRELVKVIYNQILELNNFPPSQS